jgi:peptide/nickel transport system substrate-binding protein
MIQLCQHFALFLTIIMVVGVSSLSHSQEISQIHMLRIGVANAPKNLDPALASDAASVRLLQLTHPALLRWDENYQSVGLVAKKCENIESQQVKCQLIPGQVLTNGQTLDAIKIKQWMEMVQANSRSPLSKLLSGVSISAPSLNVLTFDLPSPTQTFMSILTQIPIADPSQTQFGIGPYKLGELTATGDITLTPNNSKFPTLSFITIADVTTRVLKLKKGELDVVWNDIPPSLIQYAYEKSSKNGWSVLSRPSGSYSYIALNFRHPVLANPEVRAAMSMAINRPLVRRAILNNQALPADSLLPPGHPALYSANEDMYDTFTAESMLDEAAKEDGQTLLRGPSNMRFELTLRTSTDPLSQRVAQALQSQWREVGIDVKLIPTEWATFFSAVQKGQFDMAFLTWTGEQQPEFYYQAFHGQMTPPSGFNRGYINDPRINSLTKQMITATEPDQLIQITKDLQQYLANYRPYISLYRRNHNAIVRHGVNNCKLDTAGSYRGLMGCYKAQ